MRTYTASLWRCTMHLRSGHEPVCRGLYLEPGETPPPCERSHSGDQYNPHEWHKWIHIGDYELEAQ